MKIKSYIGNTQVLQPAFLSFQMLKRDHGGGGGSSSNGGSGSGSKSSQTQSTATVTKTTVATTTLVTSVTAPIENSGTAPGFAPKTTQPLSSTTVSNGGGNRVIPAPTPTPTFAQTPTSPPIITGTSSSTTPVSPRPIFVFDDPTNATLCGTLVLSWTYSGQAAVVMSLLVQPQPQLNSMNTTVASSPSTMHILTTAVLSTADSFTWASIDVKEGWYIAKAFDTAATQGISAASTPFFLEQGTDTSCLVTPPSSTVVMVPSPSPSSISSNPSSSKNPIGTGDIVGISLGITAGLICLLLAAFTFPRLKRRDSLIGKTRQAHLLY